MQNPQQSAYAIHILQASTVCTHSLSLYFAIFNILILNMRVNLLAVLSLHGSTTHRRHFKIFNSFGNGDCVCVYASKTIDDYNKRVCVCVRLKTLTISRRALLQIAIKSEVNGGESECERY